MEVVLAIIGMFISVALAAAGMLMSYRLGFRHGIETNPVGPDDIVLTPEDIADIERIAREEDEDEDDEDDERSAPSDDGYVEYINPHAIFRPRPVRVADDDED